MRVKHWLTLAAVVLCSICYAEAGPVLLAPGDREGDEVRAGAEEFLTAVAAADVDAARARFAGDETQAASLDAHIRFASGFDRLRRSVLQRFGPSPRTVGGNLIGDRARTAKNHYVVRNGEIASLAEGGLLDPGLRLRRVDGAWKVTHLAADRWKQREFVRLLAAFTDAVDVVRGQVESGAAASADLAWKGLDEPIRAAVLNYAPPEGARLVPPKKPGGQTPPDVPKVEAFQANFGRPIESDATRRLIATLPGAPSLSDGKFWRLTSDEAGIDMTFDGNDKHLAGVFFYAPGAYLSDGYPGEFPLGLAAEDTRRDVERRLGSPPASRGGNGIPYEADWPALGITVGYEGTSSRDPQCRLHHVLLAPPERGARAEPPEAGRARRGGPRLAFRLVSTDPKLGELLPNASEPAVPALPVLLDVLLDGSDVAQVRRVALDDDERRFGVLLKLTPEGAERMKRATAANIGRRMAIVFDGTVLYAPVIREAIGADVVFNPGSGGREETNAIVDWLHAAVNALPPPERAE